MAALRNRHGGEKERDCNVNYSIDNSSSLLFPKKREKKANSSFGKMRETLLPLTVLLHVSTACSSSQIPPPGITPEEKEQVSQFLIRVMLTFVLGRVFA